MVLHTYGPFLTIWFFPSFDLFPRIHMTIWSLWFLVMVLMIFIYPDHVHFIHHEIILFSYTEMDHHNPYLIHRSKTVQLHISTQMSPISPSSINSTISRQTCFSLRCSSLDISSLFLSCSVISQLYSRERTFNFSRIYLSEDNFSSYASCFN